MIQRSEPELMVTLERAKGLLMESIQQAGQASQWDRAQWMIQKAQELDGMIDGLRQNGAQLAPLRPATVSLPTPKPRPAKLPHFYVAGNKLTRIGPSRDGTTYEHRVTREHFDRMVERLAQLAGKSKMFETADLANAVDIPKHEPLVLLGLLEQQNLLMNIRRGRWFFVNPETFKDGAEKLWSTLPRE
jgi:hypothetical protein